MPEKTLSDMLEIMRKGDVCEYIRSGSKLPHKHTDGDRQLREEVGTSCASCRCARLSLSVCCRQVFHVVSIMDAPSATNTFGKRRMMETTAQSKDATELGVMKM